MDPNVDWVSVSALLDAASSELKVGQLLHTSVFSLFEAMSAVEIGNPKMDAGGRASAAAAFAAASLELCISAVCLNKVSSCTVMKHV
jgi:hypothetical protein